ncbi:MAG: C4-type zinc ribbon domain-containing protein, partial [Acidobacteriota bacterium]
REAELAKIGAGRDDMLADVPRDLVVQYESLFDVRDGEAVCAVENGVCMGCYTSVTPNDQARLLGGSSVVICGSCQRLLYILDA